MAGKTIPDIYCSKMTVDRLTVYLASTERGAFRVDLSLEPSAEPVDVFKRLFPGARLTEDESMNRSLAGAIDAALFNRTKGTSIPMDVSLTPFQWAVLETIAAIPFGQTRTYGAVASMAGRPLAARAVGQVMGRNPFPLIFP